MRLHQLLLRVPGGERKLRIHDRLTVLSGIAAQDRKGVVEVVIGTLAGAATVPSQLLYTDATERPVSVDQDETGAFSVTFLDDGTAAPAPRSSLGLTVETLLELMYISPSDLGLGDHASSEPAELAQAKAALAALTDQLHTARVARDAAEALRVELVALEEQIRQIDAGRARRRYARLLVDLERARAERTARSASEREAEIDRQLAAQAAEIRPAAARWREAVTKLADERRRFGVGPRLDPETYAGALGVPDHVPANLDSLAAQLADAEGRRESAAARLEALLRGRVPVPSHPAVDRLARGDQDRVWTAARRAARTAARLEAESLAVGGLMPDADLQPIVEELQRAHGAVEAAHDELEKRRFGAVAAGGAVALGAMAVPLAPVVAPLALAGAASAAYWSVLGPRHQLAAAEGWEADALGRAGVPSYLVFHLRRMQAVQDPSMREGLEQAAREHGAATAAWRHLAGDLPAEVALSLEDEVRAYAAALSQLDDLGDEVAEARRYLVEEAEPAVDRATNALMEACKPFGIEQPTLAADLVRQIAAVAAIARRQQALEAAESEEQLVRVTLDLALTAIGWSDGDLEDRLNEFETRAYAAEDRVRFRSEGRSPAAIEADIERLEKLSREQHRPEFGSQFSPMDAAEPDPAELERRRDLTAAAYSTASRLVPDVSLIADRRSAVERRVAFLQAESGERPAPTTANNESRLSDIQRALEERLSALRACGQSREPLPLFLDDCFRSLPADLKWRVLDLVDQLSGGSQVVYLSDDPEVVTWARRRASAGTVAFVDPLARAAG